MAKQKNITGGIPFTNKYNDTKFQNPGDDLDPNLKKNGDDQATKNWYLRKCEYLYAAYLRDDAYVPYSAARDFKINRLYAQGRQPNTKYMDRLTITDKNTSLRKGWMNMSWDILPILPKFRSIVIGKFEEIDYNIYTRGIDNASGALREDAKMAVMVEQKHGAWLKEFRDAIGMEDNPRKPESLPFIPKSTEELEMLSQMGAFKLEWELAMDKLLNDTAMKLNWPELKRRLIEDIVDLGLIAMQDYQDPVTKLPMARYVDPEFLIIRQTRRNDFFDISEVGEICWFTLEQLNTYDLTEDEMKDAASSYNNLWGNSYLNPVDMTQSGDRNRYDNFRVAVLDCEFQSLDTNYYESRTIDHRTVTFDLPYKAPATNKKNKRFKKENGKFYRAKWIVGTSIVFDHGLQYDVPYSQKVTPRSSFSCYRVSERSMINQCITSADDVQISILKFRNAVAESKPPGLMIEYGSISNIAQGGNVMPPDDVLKIYRDRGDLIFRYATNPNNGMPIQGGIPPVTELRGGIGPYLDELIKTLDWNINLIREITGINAIVDASTPQPDALVGTSKIAEAGTNHVLRPILMGYKNVKQRVFANLCNRWQIVGKFYAQDVTIGSGNAAFETIKVGNELYDPMFDVFCDVLITDEDKIKIDQAALASMQAAKTGSIGITMADYYYINQLMQVGNIRWAWVYLSYREKQLTDEAQARALETQEKQNEAAQGLAKMKQEEVEMKIRITEEEKRKTLELEYELKEKMLIAVEKVKNEGDAQKPPEKPAAPPEKKKKKATA